MYCPNCSKEVNPDLHYCKSCGYRLVGGTRSDDGGVAKSLAKAVGWIGVVGLLVFVFVLGMLLATGADEGAVVVVSFFYLAAVFGICTYILKYIRSAGDHVAEFSSSQSDSSKEIPGTFTNQLEPAKTPPASVTDHTTRTLEKVPVAKDDSN